MTRSKDIRNVAIIAHVDHGKTTLIDGLFKGSGVFDARKEIEHRIMDSEAQEKLRGITIKAKNASFNWKGVEVNIVDTPGHADFGGEVERALFMADGAILLVDAAEGPLPQTRFVLRKALERDLKIIVVINKVDRPDSRVAEIEEKVMELFFELALKDEHTNYPVIYASAKQGWANNSVEPANDFSVLLDKIVEVIPAPKTNAAAPFQMLVANLTYSSFLGQIAVGRIEGGEVSVGQRVALFGENGERNEFRVTSLQQYSGVGTAETDKLVAGQIALLAGAKDPKIGDTIGAVELETALPRLKVDPPCVSVRISVNTSPLAGREGTYVTSTKLEELLNEARMTNVSLHIKKTESPEVMILEARGELQIAVLLEDLRSRGYELMVSRPEIVPVEVDGKMMEPRELLSVDVPAEKAGAVITLVSTRGGLQQGHEILEGSDRVRLEFLIPTRGLIGMRTEMLTQTGGEAIFASSFADYVPFAGKRFSRKNGALVSDRAGKSVAYGLFHLEDRGDLFITEGEDVYEGMIFGEHNRPSDLNCDPTKAKKLTNMRASGKDEATKLKPITPLNLDRALEWIDEGEWIEFTPKSIRIRKAELASNKRDVRRN